MTDRQDDSGIDVDALAQEIRRVDGGNSLGAGALAEALAPYIAALSQRSEPAGVGEPVAWMAQWSEGHPYGSTVAYEPMVEFYDTKPDKWPGELTPLYATPAPAQQAVTLPPRKDNPFPDFALATPQDDNDWTAYGEAIGWNDCLDAIAATSPAPGLFTQMSIGDEPQFPSLNTTAQGASDA